MFEINCCLCYIDIISSTCTHRSNQTPIAFKSTRSTVTQGKTKSIIGRCKGNYYIIYASIFIFICYSQRFAKHCNLCFFECNTDLDQLPSGQTCLPNIDVYNSANSSVTQLCNSSYALEFNGM